MREIKFRAKSYKTGKLWYGTNRIPDELNNELPMSLFWTRVEEGVLDKDTVGEYIGVKDKFGDEVFEGDPVCTFKRVGRGYKEMSVELVDYSPLTVRWHPYHLEVTEKLEIVEGG